MNLAENAVTDSVGPWVHFWNFDLIRSSSSSSGKPYCCIRASQILVHVLTSILGRLLNHHSTSEDRYWGRVSAFNSSFNPFLAVTHSYVSNHSLSVIFQDGSYFGIGNEVPCCRTRNQVRASFDVFIPIS